MKLHEIKDVKKKDANPSRNEVFIFLHKLEDELTISGRQFNVDEDAKLIEWLTRGHKDDPAHDKDAANQIAARFRENGWVGWKIKVADIDNSPVSTPGAKWGVAKS